ncbi:class E sortase [Streptomyces kronopolitis]|uniref:class E sortase n=1 Tax=Streptomyces kronopolitis TaxID=1612435 RepID=UPI0036A2F93A
MTALRPEREGSSSEPYEPDRSYPPHDPYGPQEPHRQPDAFEAAVEALNDPLNDPLPGQAPPAGPAAPYGQPGRGRRRGKPAQEGVRQGSPWFRPHLEPDPPHRQPPAPPQSAGYGQGHGAVPAPRPASPQPIARPYVARETPLPPAPAPPAAPAPAPWRNDDETMALRQAEKPGAATVSRETDAADAADVGGSVVSRETTAESPAGGGRAARRKAAQEAAKRGGRRARQGGPADTAAADSAAAAPTSRVEARRAARAAKDSPSLIASRALGEVFITLGVLMLLFVTYQLWWTNVRAEEEAGGATTNLQHEWDKGGGEKKNLADGERFGIMYIPKLDVKAPIAEGIDKHNVLDHGMVGHYDKNSGTKTAMPWDKKGNFAVAAHRNTHGEPFRYINKLTKGDKIVVETQSSYYTYEMESILPQTSPSNTSVIGPVPPGSGFTGPGRYITLTTCTPEFTSTYRMIVWGKMVDERPRSKGKPDALAG